MRKVTCLMFAAAVVTGCVAPVDRLNNQGGGNLLTAAGKAAGGNLTALTPDEIQAASDFAIDQFNLPVPTLSDDQAVAVVQFLADNQLNKIEDIQALQQNPRGVVISDEVRGALESFFAGIGTDVNFDGPVASQGD